MKLSELKKLAGSTALQQAGKDTEKMQQLLRQMGYDPGALYQELEMESRFVDTHQDSSFSNGSVTLHSHPFYELICCRNTCGAEYLVGAERYRLQKGDIILVYPGISHRPLLPENMEEEYRRDILWISTDFFRVMREVFPEETLYQPPEVHLLRTAGTKWEFLMDKFHQGVREAEEKKVGWEAAVLANSIQLMVQLRRAVMEKSARPMKAEKPGLLDRVLSYMERHLSEKITLTQVARQFYVSESTVSQTFRQKMGVSFYRCLTQRRLIAAKTLIEEGCLLEEVAGKVGFGDYSSFYRAFRQEYGISPKQYRRHREGE